MAKYKIEDPPPGRMIDGRRVPNLIDGRPVLTVEEYRLWWNLVEGDNDDIKKILGCPYHVRLALACFRMGSRNGHFLPIVWGG